MKTFFRLNYNFRVNAMMCCFSGNMKSQINIYDMKFRVNPKFHSFEKSGSFSSYRTFIL